MFKISFYKKRFLTNRVKKMDGIQYIVSDNGDKTAVLIDLKKYKNIWEDIYDIILAKNREKEPRESLKSLKSRLQKQGRVNGKL